MIIKVNTKKVYITCSYIPPQSDPAIYKYHIEAIKFVAAKINPVDLVFVFGDFNLPSIRWEYSPDGFYHLPISVDDYEDEIFNNLTDISLYQINGIKNCFDKLLDLVFVNEPNECTISRTYPVSLPEDIYHPTIEISCNLHSCNPVKNNSSNEKFFCFKRANFTELISFIHNTNWLQLLALSDYSAHSVDEMVDKFYKTMLEYMDECIPKFKPHSKSGPPWNCKQLSTLKNLKNKYFKKYKSSGSTFFYGKYSVLRAQYNVLNKQMYQNYLQNVKSNFARDPKTFFNFVNCKRKSSGFPKVMKYLGTESSDDSMISDMFANFFASTYSTAAFDTSLIYPYDIVTNLNISPPVITTSNIFDCLMNSKFSSFSGPDGIPSCVLISCASAIAVPLSIIFNASLKCGYFPQVWKKSFIIPLFKCGNKSDVNNYRGIAKLSEIPKLFEKCMIEFLKHQISSLLTPLQHGFRKGYSTVTNVLNLTTLVNRAFNNSCYTDVIYTDFSKAFDKVNHALLLKKLDLLGFSSNYLSWIKSYLVRRTQSVKFNNSLSKSIKVNSGVPQGSHLGPILFLLFINDLPKAIVHSNTLMYADDVKIFMSIGQPSDHIVLQSDLNNFHRWCKINLMELNFKKCKHLQFSRNRGIVYQYSFDSYIIESVELFADLGILLDSKLSFVQHITMTINKARSILAFIKRWSREFNDPIITKQLYTALVRPVLEYGSVIWDPSYRIHSERLESVQKQFLIFCLRNTYPDRVRLPSYSIRLAQVNLPTLKSRRIMLNVSFIYNLITGNIGCEFLLRNISFNIPQRRLRSFNPLYVQTFRTNFAMSDPLRKLSCCFNEMYNFIDFSLSIHTIKQSIILFLNN